MLCGSVRLVLIIRVVVHVANADSPQEAGPVRANTGVPFWREREKARAVVSFRFRSQPVSCCRSADCSLVTCHQALLRCEPW